MVQPDEDGPSQDLTVVCRNCGLEHSSGLTVRPVLSENSAGQQQIQFAYAYNPLPCPKCGVYTQPAGRHRHEWQMVRDGARIVAALPLAAQREILRSAREVLSGAVTLEEARAAASPDAAPFWDLSTTEARQELWTLLSLVVAVLALLVALNQKPGGLSPQQVEQVIERVLEDAERPDGAPELPPAFRPPVLGSKGPGAPAPEKTG